MSTNEIHPEQPHDLLQYTEINSVEDYKKRGFNVWINKPNVSNCFLSAVGEVNSGNFLERIADLCKRDVSVEHEYGNWMNAMNKWFSEPIQLQGHSQPGSAADRIQSLTGAAPLSFTKTQVICWPLCFSNGDEDYHFAWLSAGVWYEQAGMNGPLLMYKDVEVLMDVVKSRKWYKSKPFTFDVKRKQ